MVLGIVSITAVCLAVVTAVPIEDVASTCDDIDTSACVLLAAQRPDFCSDRSLSETACPRYCKLCPLECYDCNTTVADFHECNTTKLCARGEVCMRKQLNSIIDGHAEYQLSCETKQTCDGLGLVIPFGKRSVQSRDISISCCQTDRCNYPTGTTMGQTTVPTPITGCKRDVLVLVDGTNSLPHSKTAVLSFLDKVFSTYVISDNDMLTSLVTFASHTHKEWEFDDHTSNSELSHALAHENLHSGSGDLNAGINYAVEEVNHVGHDGNRRDAKDVVLIITDGGAQNTVKEHIMENKLHATADNVIVVGLGHHVTIAELVDLATDSNHEFNVDSVGDLSNIYQQITKLICQP